MASTTFTSGTTIASAWLNDLNGFFYTTFNGSATLAAVKTQLGISSFAETFLDDTTAGAVLTTLGVSAFAQTVLDDTTAAAARTTLGASATTPDDATFMVVGSVDATKKLRFEVDGIATATTRVLTVPDADLTLPAVTAAGDILQASASGVLAKLALGAAGTRLHSTGSLAEWQGTWFKVGSLTRDMTAVSGSVAYTGVGFKPKAIAFTGGVNATTDIMIAGFDDGTTRGATAFNPGSAGTGQINGSSSVFLPSAAATSQMAVVTTFDTDGFTLTWTKTGSPSAGTATIYYLALR